MSDCPYFLRYWQYVYCNYLLPRQGIVNYREYYFAVYDPQSNAYVKYKH